MRRKMKIVMASHSYLPTIGGVQLHIRNLATEYVKQGHQVIIITGRESYFCRGGLPWHEKMEGIDIYRYHIDYPRLGWNLPILGLRSWFQVLIDLPVNTIRQALLFRKFNPDVINVFFVWHQAFLLLLTRRWAKNSTLVLSPLGPNDVFDNVHPKPWFWRILRKKILLSADRVHCFSDTMENGALSLGVPKEKCSWVPLGVDTDEFRPIDKDECRRKLGLPLDKKIVLYIARLTKNKGAMQYLEACRHINNTNKETYFYLLGDGILRQEIRGKINEYGMKEYFLMIGEKPNSEISLWINASDLMVSVSLFDSFGLVHSESLACGRPVIAAADWQAPPNFANEIHGLLVPAGDVMALAETILKALNMNWDYRRISKDWSCYTWSDISKKMILMYNVGSLS
jgi:glycosyltransferase involved in cell wall biosynthesis